MRIAELKKRGINGNGAGIPLTLQSTTWQTPKGMGGGNSSRSGDRKDELLLEGQARTWPTPTEDNANNCGGPSRSRPEGYSDLTVAVSQWPTATAGDSEQHKKYAGGNPTLSGLVHSLQGRAIPDGQPSSSENPGSRRRLNPAFAAWLMGMPWWWTNPAPISFARSEMASWRCRLRSRLQFLLGGC